MNMEFLGKAIDLGCGALKDTTFLLENGFKVLAIDKEKIAFENVMYQNNLETLETSFEQMTLKKNSVDLVNAMYSLHFVTPENYSKVWTKVTNAIKSGGYFVGNFIGENDSWNSPSFNFTILNKAEVKKMFKEFDVLYFEETEKDGKTVLGHNKHWHVYSVIAKKR